MNSLSTQERTNIVSAKLAELRAIPPQHKNLWLLIQSNISFQDGWESGEDVFTPDKKITSSVNDDKKILEILRKISIEDAKKELARYGINRFDEPQTINKGYKVDYTKITDSPTIEAKYLESIYGKLLRHKMYYDPKKTLTNEERVVIFNDLRLGNYLTLLYDKIKHLYHAQLNIERTQSAADHLLTDLEFQRLNDRRPYSSRPDSYRLLQFAGAEGTESVYNSREDTRHVRAGLNSIRELLNARQLIIDIKEATAVVNAACSHACDAFPVASQDNPEYHKLQTETKKLLASLIDSMNALKVNISSIDEHIGE